MREFILSLGYKKASGWTRFQGLSWESYHWFDDTDYRSWSGVELSIDKTKDGKLSVSTRTVVSRSYFDLEKQNHTISALRRRFGGSFTTDAGVNRCMRPRSDPPTPAASGCHLAFSRLGQNIGKAVVYSQARTFPNHKPHAFDNFFSQVGLHPENLSGNMLVAFCVSIIEEYLKSCFVALLKYSPQKERFLRGVRLRGDQLARISDGQDSVENAVAETLSFQRISIACKNFEGIDTSLDLAAPLRKPLKERPNQPTLFDMLEGLAEKRNRFVHQASFDLDLNDVSVKQTLHDLALAMERIQRAISERYGWQFEQTWGFGGAEPALATSPDGSVPINSPAATASGRR
ncbi:hypothetical protein [Bradyrhizobium sp. USDA 4449]